MPSPSPRAAWRVAGVTVVEPMLLDVSFQDGTKGRVDLSRLVHAPDAGVFAPLADPARFAKVRVELGAVSWPDGPDLAPDAMYRAIRAHGIWKP